MLGWSIIRGVEYLVGAIVVVLTYSKHPRSPTLVSSILTFAMFAYFFIAAVSQLYWRGWTSYNEITRQEEKFYFVRSTILLLPLIWALNLN
jgi:uncharacterized membrane protein